MDIIERIKRKLAYLQTYDDGDVTEAVFERKFFIEQHFPYEIGGTHTDEEIVAFEAEYRIRLPEDYRHFIMEVGSSVPSPGYHMYSPLWDMLSQSDAADFFDRLDHSDDEIDEDEWWKEEAPVLKNLDRPFLFNETITDEGMARFFAEHDIPSDESFLERLNDGYLWLIYSGCTCWYILITAGEARGQIWYMDTPTLYTPIMLLNDTLFTAIGDPVLATQAQRVTFTQWYEAWLNNQISSAQEHWQKQGRSVPPLALD